MTTARERYEAKTKVVTFRVSQKLYRELQKIKAESGLSFADLVKLGAGIAHSEIEDKIEEIHGLQAKLEQLRKTAEAEKQLVADTIEKEKQAQHENLKRELEIFQLFDLGWSIEEAMFRMQMGRMEVSDYFNKWAGMRGEKEQIQEELFKKCLRRHIAVLVEQITWRATKGALEDAKTQLERCRYLLINPSHANEQERFFLLTEYSYSV